MSHLGTVPARRESLPDPETSDDDDADFGRGAKEAARREAEEDRRRLEEGKRKGGKRKGGKGVKKEDEGTRGKRVKREKSSGKEARIKFREEKVKRELLSSDEDVVKPTRPVPKNQRTSQASVVGKKWGIRIQADESSDGEVGTSEEEEAREAASKGKRKLGGGKGKGKGKKARVFSDSEEEKRVHLVGRWRHKGDPEKMAVGRKRLEEKHNPLIKLLGIKIEVINSDGDEDVLAEDDKKEFSDDEPTDVKPFRTLSDWNKTSTTSAPAPRDWKVQVKPEIEDVKMSLDSDSEPPTETDGDMSDCKPAPAALAAVADDDDEKEPTTEEESEEEKEDEWQRAQRLAKQRVAERKLAREKKEREEREEKEGVKRAQFVEAAAQRALAVEAEEEEEEEAEEEPTLVEIARRESAQARVVYPLPAVKRRRPRFEIKNREQDLTGPHILAPGVEIPEAINRFLRPYQRKGVEFMYRQYRKGKGGILGDDMGLGKTIQVIAFLSAIMDKTGMRKTDNMRRAGILSELDRPFPKPSAHGKTCLITCPASVVHNWERELEKWGYFEVGIYEGSRKGDVLVKFNNGYYDLILCGIEACRDNIEALAASDFSLIFVDEAHRVKNPKSQTTKSLHEFPSKLRYGLTGTAIQNRLAEFWCILDWANPGDVGTEEQWNVFVSTPLKHAQKANATDEQLAKGRTRAAALVGSLLPTMFLRRTKDLIKDQLPVKTDNIVLCPLTPLQLSVYKTFLASEDVQTMLTIRDPCLCGKTDDEGAPWPKGKCCHQGWVKMIFKNITLFQKVANHLALIYPDKEEKNTNKKKFTQDLEWARMAFPSDFNSRNKARLDCGDTTLCGKWQILKELLDLWDNQGNKVLIFSMSLKVLSLLKEMFEMDGGYKVVCLDGSVPNDQRMALVDSFNEDPDVYCFLISSRAGGVGLNLTAANRVIIFDPNWNPAHDLQAMDRAYRFGQTRDVNVYRLIGAGTLEELIYNRQQYKRAQAGVAYDAAPERRLYTGVEGEKDDQGELWGIKNMFKLQEGYSLTEKSIQSCEMAELDYALKNTTLGKLEKASKKSKKSDDGSASETDDVVVDDDAALKALVGIDDAEPEKPISPAEAARRQKIAEEQKNIAQILANSNVTFSAISDATLGGSKAEEDRGKRAIIQSKLPRSKALPPPKAKLMTADPPSEEQVGVWNPKSRRSRPSRPPPTKLKPPPTSLSTLACSMGISPDVPTEDLIAPSGYTGTNGATRLAKELDALRGNERTGRINEILEQYRRSETSMPGWQTGGVA